MINGVETKKDLEKTILEFKRLERQAHNNLVSSHYTDRNALAKLQEYRHAIVDLKYKKNGLPMECTACESTQLTSIDSKDGISLYKCRSCGAKSVHLDFYAEVRGFF